MVNYKVRSFYEKDTGTAGADVIIYDDSGDVVDTLLITTESTYNDLVEQLEGIDEKYLDRTDVLNILQNTNNEIVAINATLLNGQSADFYAKNNHNHNDVYAPKDHVGLQSTEGVLGHTKIIDNVSRSSFVYGEALSAHQGKLLSDRITTVSSAVADSGWKTLNVSTGNGFSHYTSSQTVQYRKIGKIVNMRGAVRNNWNNRQVDHTGWYIGTLPAGYCPSHYIQAVNQGSGINRHLLEIESDGTVSVGARYGGNAYVDMKKDAWLTCNITFFVD
ncbi:hypothetical protein [Methanobrevibacter sp.]